jgi:hypothetical protein
MPSGEALKSAEAGLVAKVRSAQTHFGNVWEDMILLGLRIMRGVRATDGVMLSTLWEIPESRNRLEEAQRAEILAGLGVSQHTLMLEQGYDPEVERERREREQSTVDEAASRLLERGQVRIPEYQPDLEAVA